MNTTKVFSENIKAYNAGTNLIVNPGGTSSSKTYSILQLLLLIALYSPKPLVISIVSYSLPHLKLGAMRDFENILIGEGIMVDDVKNKTDLFYKIGQSVIEFFSVDNLAKVHGPRRDILYMNECNHVKSYDIYTQLSIRTKECVFLDYNPSREFWVHTDVLPNEEHKLIRSTYLDNDYLDQNIIRQIESRKSNENWWKVYGLGEVGRLEGAILQNWIFGDFNTSIPYGYGLDFGVTDPDAMVKVAVDNSNRKIYWKEELHQNRLSTRQLYDAIQSRNVGSKLIIADSQAKRTILDLKSMGLKNIQGVVKNPIVQDIKTLLDYQLIIDPESYNLQRELNNWVWLDKKGEIPLDAFNHLIDAGRYYSQTIIKPYKRQGMKITK